MRPSLSVASSLSTSRSRAITRSSRSRASSSRGSGAGSGGGASALAAMRSSAACRRARVAASSCSLMPDTVPREPGARCPGNARSVKVGGSGPRGRGARLGGRPARARRRRAWRAAAVTLLSAPGAAGYAGCGWWRAMVEAARAEVPGVEGTDVLDCLDQTGRAIEALRYGLRRLVLAGGRAGARRRGGARGGARRRAARRPPGRARPGPARRRAAARNLARGGTLRPHHSEARHDAPCYHAGSYSKSARQRRSSACRAR